MAREVLEIALKGTVSSDWRLVRTRIEHECARLHKFPQLAPSIISQQLLISGEDHRHAYHPGFDPIAIARAIWRRLNSRSHEGASTIEQQIVRVITGRYERTLCRKIREILLAILVARTFPKELLPAVYLAIGYYGWRMNGYLQACRRLGLAPRSLTLDEAAALVARLKYPEPKQPPHHRVIQIKRRSQHLRILYHRHISTGNYKHLNVAALRRQFESLDPLPEP